MKPPEGRGRLAAPVLAALLVFLASVSFFAATLGLTYDEPVYAYVGERHWEWCRDAVTGRPGTLSHAALERGWGNSGPTPATADWHPPLGKLLLAAGRRLPLPGGPFGRQRAANVALFAACGAVLWIWLASAAGRTAGIAAALCWWTLPRAIGHGNLGTIDMPVACFSTLALALGWRLARQPGPRAGLGFGLALAAACLSKFNGVLTAPAVLLAVLRRRAAWPWFGLGCAVAATAGWLSWPWLWYDGWEHLRAVLAFHGRHGTIGVEYFGRIYAAEPPPWHYPLVMLAITTPLTVLLAAGLSAARRDHRSLAGFLALGLLAHVAPYLSPEAAKYNGVRLFLPALPLVAGLAGLGVAAASGWLRARLPALAARRGAAAALVASAVALPGLVGVLEVHPYPLAYYNRLVGGPAGADARGFEVCYWGEPMREALALLSRRAPRGATIACFPPGFLSSLESYRQVGLLRDDLVLVGGDRPSDFVIYQNRRSEWDRRGLDLAATKQPVATIWAGPAPAAFIWSGR